MGHAGDSHDDEPLDEHHDEGLEPRGSVPDPLDRVWRHPSELGPPQASPGFRAPRPERPRRAVPGWLTPVLAGAAGALVTVAVLGAAGVFSRSSGTPTARTTSSNTDPAARVTAESVAAAVGPSVVSVVAHTSGGVQRGSGVCVRHDRNILTSARLIGDAHTVEVLTADGEAHTARVVGRDTTTDLALLSIDADLDAAQLADGTLSTGSSVWIVGAPTAANSPWMSSGLVSSAQALVAESTGPTTDGLLETDAVSNEWAAGGALVDHSGNVAGIVLSPIDDGRTTYAVPIATAVAVADGIRAHGVAAHGSLGVEGVDGPAGPTVRAAVSGGAAARAGIKGNDVVMKVDGRDVATMGEVMAIVRHFTPGQTITVEIQRGNRQLDMPVKLGSLTPTPAATVTTASGATVTTASGG